MRWLRWLAVCLLPAISLNAPGASPGTAQAKVTYIAGESIYIDAGVQEGITEETVLQVVRGGAPVATLKVQFLSAHRVSCLAVEESGEILVGDTVTFTPAAPREAEAVQGGESRKMKTSREQARDRRSRRRRGRPVRGRAGVQFLSVSNGGAGQTDYSQPALDFRLEGHDLGDSGLGVNVDVRARQTRRTLSDGTRDDDSRTRVYRMAAEWQGREMPLQVTFGRQFQPNAAGISIFDGVAATWRLERWSFGVLSGTQPDPVDFGVSGEIQEHGLYARYRTAGENHRRLSLTTGLIGSYENSEINREYAYVQALLGGRRTTVYLTQEVDFNRGWKKAAGGGALDSTSTFLNLRYRATDRLDFQAGIDNRKNIRLYRDRTTPETEFDDAYRTGVWAGAGYRFLDHYRVGFRYRTSSGGTRGTSDNLTGRFGLYGFTGRNAGGNLRLTHYSSDLVEGDLLSLSGGLDLTSRLRVELSGGVRDETDVFDNTSRAQTWYGLDLDYRLGRRWYLIGSWQAESGDLERIDQVFTSLSYRF